VKVSPGAEKKPLLTAGRYGAQGEAQLTDIYCRRIPRTNAEKAEDPNDETSERRYYVDFPVTVDDPDQGRVFVHANAMGGFHTQIEENTGSMAPIWLASLGINPDHADFEDVADEKGNHKLIGAEGMFPMKVVVDVGVREYKASDGTKVQQNFLKGIVPLA